MPRRVLIGLVHLDGGGLEVETLRLAEGLSKSGLQVSLAVLEKRGFFLASVPSGVQLFHLPKDTLWDSLLAPLRWHAILLKTKPDTLLVNLPYLGLLTRLIRFGKNRPRLFFHEMTSACRYDFHRGEIGARRRWMADRFYPWLIQKYFDGTIVPSVGLKNEMVPRWKFPENTIRVIANHIDSATITELSALPPDVPFPQDEKPLFLFAGRLVEQKNLYFLLECFAVYRRTEEGRLLLLGSGPEEAGLRGHVNFLGIDRDTLWIPFQKNPYPYLKRATALLLTSHYEGFGNVLIEAMACGCPSIAVRCPSGPDEIIQDGINGFLCPVQDPPALVQAMKQLADPRRRATLSAQAGQRALDFEGSKVIPRWLGTLQ